MPGTHEEIIAAAMAVFRFEIAPDCLEDIRWEDGERITEAEQREIIVFAGYEFRLRLRRRQPAQMKALRLLRRFLTTEQKRQLRTSKEFRVQGSNGGVYRLRPYYGGSVWQVELHKRHWYGIRSFCIHEMIEDTVPAADRTIGHLLMLTTDETEFVATSNVTERPPQCWDSAYLRRMRRPKTPEQRREIEEATERVRRRRAESAEAMRGDMEEIANANTI